MPTTISGDSGVNKVVLGTPVISGAFGFRNKIINGKMEVAQRGTSSTANGYQTVDRFQNQLGGSGAVTQTQSTDVPAGSEFQYSYRMTVTTADTVIDASDFYQIQHVVEGYNVRELIGKTFTLSFWVRSSKTGIHCISFMNSLPDRAFISEYTINVANTWEYKTITVSGGLITTGTWDWTNGLGLRIFFALATGSNFQNVAGTWVTSGGRNATANQVNCMDTVGNIFAITGVQLEQGSTATSFEHRPYGLELSLCHRYYYKRQALNFATGSTNGFTVTYNYPTTMRAVPTMTNPMIDSNFVAGPPASNQWALQVANVVFVSRTGTLTPGASVGVDCTVIYYSGMTLSVVPNYLQSNLEVTFSAEL